MSGNQYSGSKFSSLFYRVGDRKLKFQLRVSTPSGSFTTVTSTYSSMPLSYYDEIELEDMDYDESKQVFHYPCPCGDRFEISLLQLRAEEDVARCPSCTLIIRVIYDPLDLEDDQGTPPCMDTGAAQVSAAA